MINIHDIYNNTILYTTYYENNIIESNECDRFELYPQYDGTYSFWHSYNGYDLLNNMYLRFNFNKFYLEKEDYNKIFGQEIIFSIGGYDIIRMNYMSNILLCYLHDYDIKYEDNNNYIIIPIFQSIKYIKLYSNIYHESKITICNPTDAPYIENIEFGCTGYKIDSILSSVTNFKEPILQSSSNYYQYKINKKYDLNFNFIPKLLIINFFNINIDLFTVYISIENTNPIKYTKNDFFKIQIEDMDFWIIPMIPISDEKELKELCKSDEIYELIGINISYIDSLKIWFDIDTDNYDFTFLVSNININILMNMSGMSGCAIRN